MGLHDRNITLRATNACDPYIRQAPAHVWPRCLSEAVRRVRCCRGTDHVAWAKIANVCLGRAYLWGGMAYKLELGFHDPRQHSCLWEIADGGQRCLRVPRNCPLRLRWARDAVRCRCPHVLLRSRGKVD